MTMPTSGSISLLECGIILGGSTPHSLDEYYGYGMGPVSGTISLEDLYGAAPPAGHYEYTNNGTFTFTVPSGVYNICILCVGGGGGGGRSSGGNIGPQGGAGGGLSYENNVSVTPGENLSVVVGAHGLGGTINATSGTNGQDSWVKRGSTYLTHAEGGQGGKRQNSGFAEGGPGGSTLGYDGGGRGGNGGEGDHNQAGGAGGGAGGYSGNGGRGGYSNANRNQSGGAGGGGGGGESDSKGSGGGGGVGLRGEGSSGSATGNLAASNGAGGFGGSGGANGVTSTGGVGGRGGDYGGGGGTDEDDSQNNGGRGGGGAVRILWGIGRSFPNTSVSQSSY